MSAQEGIADIHTNVGPTSSRVALPISGRYTYQCRANIEPCCTPDLGPMFSHGYAVTLEELKEYVDYDHSELKLESKCLARFHDDLWYKATVIYPHDTGVTVTFDSYQDDPVPLPWGGVIPLPDISDEQSSFCKEGTDDDVDDDITEVLPIDREESDDDDALPVFLWKLSSHGLGDLGRWEEHTKLSQGIGSRLLQKMGYVPGKGLGCRGEGRVEPVPIQLLPQVGKSLDRIMALKELAGDRDIFDAMKQQDRKDRKMVRKLEQQYHKLESRPDVFEFINKRLGGKKGESLLKTSEEMKTVEKELVKLKQSLNRNENRSGTNKNIAIKIRTKISSLEAYLNKLKPSESAIESHKQKRKDLKNLTIF
ncbi:zinc finger CCCH-type with G patch domain-containing protein-like [Dreissena polymorpha]|uniref:zinc finger CCCH-type with G patch domain-containing protein-like n=1 Tax=Dreissena polymorpha TaxID=45954 RepID=UPI0022652DC7|nr:zinc finger CCCH-type with G patch domain-containing protein-like [Dreissena polymorpha]